MGTFFLGHSHVGHHRVGIQEADVLRTHLFLEARFPHGDFSNIGSSHIYSIPLLQGGESTYVLGIIFCLSAPVLFQDMGNVSGQVKEIGRACQKPSTCQQSQTTQKGKSLEGLNSLDPAQQILKRCEQNM